MYMPHVSVHVQNEVKACVSAVGLTFSDGFVRIRVGKYADGELRR